MARPQTGEGIDFVTCQLCRRAFRSISWSHLTRKHGADPEDCVRHYKQRFGVPYSRCRDSVELGRAKFIELMERTGHHWTPESVLEALRTLYRREQPLIRLPVTARRPLVLAARRLFGSLAAARRAAAIPMNALRVREIWTLERVIAELRAIGRVITFEEAQAKHPRLAARAPQLFGSWGAAYRAAGFEYERRRGRASRWTADHMKALIQARGQKGKPLTWTAVRRDDPELARGARHVHGTWEAALAACGIAYEGINQRARWTPERMKAKVLELVARGERVTGQEFARRHPGLMHAGRKLYGTWGAALAGWGVRVLT